MVVGLEASSFVYILPSAEATQSVYELKIIMVHGSPEEPSNNYLKWRRWVSTLVWGDRILCQVTFRVVPRTCGTWSPEVRGSVGCFFLSVGPCCAFSYDPSTMSPAELDQSWAEYMAFFNSKKRCWLFGSWVKRVPGSL